MDPQADRPDHASLPRPPAALATGWARACVLLVLCVFNVLAGATYQHATTAFSFVDSSTHTRITSWPGCSDKTGDDSLSALLDLGFTFNFGGTDYTQVRVHTNGRLQFNNTACGFGTQSVGPPRTYPLPMPDASTVRTMRIYGADLDLNSGGTITFAQTSLGDQKAFIVTWNQVSAWQAGGSTNLGAGTTYTFQIQILESGEFRYMYGDSDDITEPANQAVGPAQIGWQLTTTDFRLVQSGLPPNRSGLRFFIEAPIAEYRFEQGRLTGAAGEILDSSANGFHGTRVDSPAAAPLVESVTGRICRGIEIPASATQSHLDAVDTGLPVLKIGSRGTITFWYRSARDWSATDNVLLDGSSAKGRSFTFGKTRSGRLRFVVTDNASSPNTIDLLPSIDNAVPANTWKHLAISWRITAGDKRSELRIYLDGKLYASATESSSGELHRSLSTLYLGDSRIAESALASRTDAAGGTLDEVRIYNYEAPQTVVQRDMALTRPCGGIDRFGLSHVGTAVTCEPATVKIVALTASGEVVSDYGGVVDLSTSIGAGDWSLLSGAGSLDNGDSNDGKAVYRFASADGGGVAFGLRHTAAGSLNIDVSDGSASERSGRATAADDPDLEFVETGFVFGASTRARPDDLIGTQIAGKSSALAPGAQTLTLRAVRTKEGTSACEAALAGTQLIEFGFECVAPARCSGRSLLIDGGSATSVAGNPGGNVTAFTPVKMAFDAAGATSFATTFDDAGSVRLHARRQLPLENGKESDNAMRGSSNVFAWRPFALDVTIPGNPGATSASGAAYLAAGESFGASVRAVVWSAADDRNSDGIADGMQSGDSDPANNARLSDNSTAPNFAPAAPLSLGAALLQPVAGRHPGLSGAPAATLANGIAKVSGLRYDEVGIIEVSAVQTGDYLGIGAAATAAIRGLSGAVGRFHPARFALTPNQPLFADGCDKGAFTYMDQPFAFSTAPALTVTALNALGTTTRNYTTSGFFRLHSTLAGRRAADSAARDLRHTAGAGAAATDTTTGTGSFVLSLPAGSAGDRFTYTRSTPVGPFSAAVDLTMPAQNLTDTDAICFDAADDGACDDFTFEDIAGANLRYGRLATDNVLGSELLPLAAPVRAEYFNGRGFTRNDADVCTAIPAQAIDLGSGSADTEPAPGETAIAVGGGKSIAGIAHAPLASGLLGLGFSAPGSGNIGELDYRIDLGIAASEWLRYDWNGDGKLVEDPRGRASFGLYAGPRTVIYQRDVWR